MLLNLNPDKFEKPKDQLYMDFFVKYTEIFVKDQQSPQAKAGVPARRSVKNTSQKMRLVAA